MISIDNKINIVDARIIFRTWLTNKFINMNERNVPFIGWMTVSNSRDKLQLHQAHRTKLLNIKRDIYIKKYINNIESKVWDEL